MILTSFIAIVFGMDSRKQSLQDPWLEAKEFGIDTMQLSSNLKISYEARAMRHQQALDLISQLIEAKQSHEKSKQSHSDSSKS